MKIKLAFAILKSAGAAFTTLLVLTMAIAGCSPKPVALPPLQPQVEAGEVRVVKAPGIVEYVWEEPNADVIDVPPGLDPEGHYYRPAHQAVVEIRQGKWKHYRAPDESASEVK